MKSAEKIVTGGGIQGKADLQWYSTYAIIHYQKEVSFTLQGNS